MVVICSHALYLPEQHEVESRFDSELARRLQWYPLQFPDTPLTNLAQVLYGSRGGYPYQWHEWIRIYGTNAGFAHSLAEKYVAVPPGVFSHRREEFSYVSARPFPKRGDAYRTVIYRQTNNYWAEAVREDWVRRAFQDAKQTIAAPLVAASPQPPPPSTSRNPRRYYLSVWL